MACASPGGGCHFLGTAGTSQVVAEALGLALHKVMIPSQSSNETYEQAMGEAIGELERDGVTAMGFGDLFLRDIRVYRERMLKPTRISPVFPIWGRATGRLAR